MPVACHRHAATFVRKIQLIRLRCLVLLKGAGALAQDGGSGCVGEVDDGRRLQRHGAGVDGQCYTGGGVAFGEERRLLHGGLGVVVVGRDRCHQQRMLQLRSQSRGNGAGGNTDSNAAALLECLRERRRHRQHKGEWTWKILAQQPVCAVVDAHECRCLAQVGAEYGKGVLCRIETFDAAKALNGAAVEGIAGESIESVGGDYHYSALAYGCGSGVDDAAVGSVAAAGLHCFHMR